MSLDPKPGAYADVMPDLDAGTYEALKESVARRGVLVPIVIDQHGRLLDGHNRMRATVELGLPTPPMVTVKVGNHQDGRDVALLLNSVRRHLDGEARRAVVAELRKTGNSLRAIAGAVGVSEGQVRKDIAAEEVRTGTHLTPDRSTGADGKSYPSRRPEPAPPPPVTPVPAEEEPDPECASCHRPTPSHGLYGGLCDGCRVDAEYAASERTEAPRPKAEKRPSERMWEPAKALGKGLRSMPPAMEVMEALPADSLESFDQLADEAIAWGKRWKEERKAASRLRLMGVKGINR